MPEEIRTAILESVRSRLHDAHRILAMADVSDEEAGFIQTLLRVTDLAVCDCIQNPA